MKKIALFVVALCISSCFFAQSNNSDDNKIIIKGYLNELQILNEYLVKNNWKSGYYGKVSVNENAISISYNLKPNYSFKASDIDKAFVDNNKKVIIKCKEENKSIYDNETKQYKNFIVIDERVQKDKIKNTIAELLNNLISKVINSPTKYAETPLEIATAKLHNFLEGKKAASYTDGSYSYFDKVYMENDKLLRFDYIGTSYEVINLELVNEIYIEHLNKENPWLLANSVEKGGYCCNHNGTAYEHALWGTLSNSDCKKFYVLLGNVLDTYRSANDKHYKVEQTYQERVDIMNAPTFLSAIQKGAIVRFDDIFKKMDFHKDLKKLKGTEVVVNYLDIDHSYSTYKGKILANNKEYYVEELKITFIKDKDGNDLATYKAKLEGDIKKSEQAENDKDNELKTQWHPVSKLLHQFIEDAKKVNGLAKYAKLGTKAGLPKEPKANYTYYQLTKYENYTKCIKWVDFDYTETPDTKKKLGSYLSVWFPKEYLEKYVDLLKFQAPIFKTDKNPDKIYWVEKSDKQGFVLFYRDKILMILDTAISSNPKEKNCILYIYEYVE